MRISGQKHCNGAKFYSLVLLAFLWTLAGTAFADEPLHVFDAGATSFFMESNAIAGVGDINQDGHEDYLVGVPENTDIEFYKGAVYLVSGADGGQLAMFEGESSYEMFGYGVACAGDVNQDGVNDFLIASMYALGDRAAVFVYSGADGSRLHTLPSPYPNTDFGNIMASVGDKDGDGIPDFAIAAPYCYADHRGAVFLYSTAMGGVIIYAWSGDTQYAAFGRDLAAADIDGDGMLDLVISAPGKDEGSSDNVGALYWVPGGFGPMAILAQGDIAQQQLGFRIAAVDDISGDGIKDIAALDRTGQIHLFSGVYPAGAPLGSFASGMTESEIPDWVQMVSIGDFNGDGAGDLLVGRPEAEGGTGVVQVLSGLDGWVLKTYPGAPYGLFGSRLAADVDLDGNGSQDFLIGAGGTYAGAVFAYAGFDSQPADSDGDGMPDSWETDHGLDPQNPGDAVLDPDADGLTNLGEYQNQVDPNNPDSDWDAMLDGWEVDHGLNPLVFADAWEDPDGDGLFNIDEFFLDTDPHNGDTDGDTLPDAWEAQSGLNPTDAADADFDSDGDGLTNLAEYAAGTHPRKSDTDADGLNDGDEITRGLNPLQADSDGDSAPDGWEDQYGLDPLDGSDGAGDMDADGLTNQSEYAAGTNPTLTDSDGDTLSDGDEAHIYQTDPAKSDTDNDGLDDGAEITVHLTQPLNADSDGDQLTDGAEVHTHHTDPLDTDSDDDGMPDGWEVNQSFDATNAGDAAQDADNDAATNLEEYLAGTDPHNPATYPGGPGTLKWSFAAPPIASPASLDPNGTVYVTSSDGNLYALDADGTQKWSAALTAASGTAALIAENGTIYVNEKNGSAPQTLYSIDPDGTLNWSVELPGYSIKAHTPALADDGTIYVPAGGTLMAFNPDGTEKWTATTDGYDTSSPAVAHDGTIYVKSYQDKLYAINPDGSQKWVFSMYAYYKLADVGPVIADDGTVYVWDNQGYYSNGRVHAVNPDGTEKWNYWIGSGWGPLAIGQDGTLYVSARRFYALSADGALNWVIDLPGLYVSSPAIAADGTLYVSGSVYPYHAVHALNPDGSIIWSYETREQESLTDPVLGADGTLYVGSASGNLYALNTNGMEPAASAWPMAGHDARHTGNAEITINHAPEISIASPADGSLFNVDDGAIALTAIASDPDEGDLSASVQWYSSIDGAVVSPAALSVGAHTLTATVTDSRGSTAAASITVTIEAHVNVAPTLSITAPADGANFNEDDGPIAFSATAADLEDGDLGAAVQWRSDLDGAFTPPAALSAGTHQITAEIADSGGLSASAGITLSVAAHVDVTPPDAGPDQWVSGDSATLAANTPLVGTGVWSVLAGSGTVTDPSDPNSTVTGLSLGINTFIWSISYNGGPAEQDVVAVTREGELVGRDAVYAGTGAAGYSGDGGPALDARFETLNGIAVDRFGNVYLSDYMRIRKIDALSGIITTISGTSSGGFSGDGGSAVDALLNVPTGLAADWAGNLFIADRNNYRIRRIDALTGIISTVAGNGIASIGGNEGDAGPALNAALDNPEDVAVDEQGNLYIADKRNDRIRKVDAATGIITTVAGSGAYGGDEGYSGDGGPATEAKLSSPEGVAVDALGNIYIADTGNGVVRKVEAATGIISTVMTLANANGVTADVAGNIYAAANCGILKLDPFGTLTTIQSQCLGQKDIASDAAGNLYVTESSRQVEKITFDPAMPPVITITAPADGFRADYEDGPIVFDFTATDAEDGDLTSSVVWESSIDGIVQSPATLSVGTHTLTARVTDSDGLTTSESIACTVASTADQYAIKGGVDAIYVDSNNTGQFTQATIGGYLSVAVGRLSYANLNYNKRVNLEIDLSALRASGQHVSRAAIQLYASAIGGYPLQIDIYGYAADGVAELADAYSGDQIIGSFQADGIGNYEADITDYINQLIDSGVQWVGLSLRSANESGTSNIDEHIDFKGFDYTNSLSPGVALLVSYAEPPVVSISSPADNIVVSEDDGPIAFTATAADPEDGDISADIQWSSSLDGAFTPPAALSVGTHTVTATVTDSSGLSTVSTITVIVGPHVNLAPEVTITAPLDGDTVYRNNRQVAFAAVAVDAEQGDIGSSVQWSSSLDGAFTPPAILSAGTHVITASATDTQGLTGSAAITLHVEESDNDVLDYEQFIETGTVANVGSQNWTTVHLAGSYASMVVVCTPVYDNTAPPMVTRIQNAAGSSFQLKLDRADGQTEEVTGIDVYYVVVQEGVYTQAEHGITMEAVRMVSTATDGKGSWNGQPQTYANSYLHPVVIGQVMTTNDPAFSAFWSCGASKSSPPSASTLKVGKHAGEDPSTYRVDETLGYLVIESASGTIGGLKYSAGVGADIVTGLPKGTNPGISYGFTGVTQPTCAVLGQTAMDGGDGGWPILYGSDPISADTLSLVIDEDKMFDAERNHTTEQVAYLVLGQ